MTKPWAVNVQNLRKTYRDGLWGRRRIEALAGVSLDVQRGEIFGLLGPNGAGKTTLIKVLLGMVGASGGAATLLDRPAGSRAARKEVGYLPEHHRIPRHHTGNSALTFFGNLSGLSRAEVARRRGPLLATVGLAEWGNTSIKKYSKGMMQRLGLALAMLHDPLLLILDEPTDGVDPVGRSEMRTVLLQLKAAGKTVFINSHLLQEVELVCDRVAILDRGRVLQQGSIAELTARAQSEVRLIVAGSEDQLRRALAAGPAVDTRALGPDQFEIVLAAPDQATIDGTIDRLRGQGMSLISLSPTRHTLEEAFLSILKQARGNP
ncbi:MAG: ABC transporter ATP-binding protein [Pirellulales bacterium]